jgi:dipeptidyl aminopeptidase/acylaminoacyl peptidase
MYRRGFAAALAAMLCGTVAEAQSIPIDAFAAMPAMEAPAISPDGRRLAFISYTSAGGVILVTDSETMELSRLVDATVAKPRAVGWASNDVLLFAAGEATSLRGAAGQFELTTPYGVDLSDGVEITQLLQDRARLGGGAQIGGFQAFGSAPLVGYERGTGRVLFPKFDTEAGRLILYSVDPTTDRRSVVDRGTRFTNNWVVDESGAPVFRVDFVPNTNRFAILARSGNSWTVIRDETVAIPEMRVFGLAEGGELVVGYRPPGGRFGLYVLSTTSGEIGRAVYVHDRYDVTNVRLDPYSNRVVGAGVEGEPTTWFDRELADQQLLLNDAFPEESPTIMSWSQDRTRFIVATQGDDRPPNFYHYNAEVLSADQIASSYPPLDAFNLPSRESYSFTARDGVTVPGYLTRPIGATGPTPLVVLPHGGPAARDVSGFDWLAHYLAVRGYTVVQPNFRGSGGFGDEWRTAGFGQWGTGVMQHDVSDAVAALVAEGVADRNRVCIVGASYGGYAALAGAAFTPELYRCAASISGVSDLGEILDFTRNRFGAFSPILSYWALSMGGAESDGFRDRVRAVSPARHVESVSAPVLLIHGRDDAVVPIEQSRIMERALRGAGKSVDLVEIEGGDHWLTGTRTRLETLRALDAFLAAHLGG